MHRTHVIDRFKRFDHSSIILLYVQVLGTRLVILFVSKIHISNGCRFLTVRVCRSRGTDSRCRYAKTPLDCYYSLWLDDIGILRFSSFFPLFFFSNSFQRPDIYPAHCWTGVSTTRLHVQGCDNLESNFPIQLSRYFHVYTPFLNFSYDSVDLFLEFIPILITDPCTAILFCILSYHDTYVHLQQIVFICLI